MHAKRMDTRSGQHRLSLIDGGAVVFLCLLSVVFYRHIALSNRILTGDDAFTYFYPYRAYAAEMVCSAKVPLWNPYLFLGVPFLANPQAAVFYPLNLVLCGLSAPKLLAWSIVIHAALAAVLCYLYARQSLRLSPLPAVLSASTFAFGGFLTGQVEHINQLNVSTWFPLLLLLWDLLERRRSRWPVLLGMGATVGIGLLAGHTQSSYISLLGLGVYALLPTLPRLWHRVDKHSPTPPWDALRWKVAPALRVLLQLGIVGAVGIALAAIQVLPTLELAQLSIRRGGLAYGEAVAFSLKPVPRLLRYTFLPPWGDNLADAFGGSYFTEYLAYVGLLALALAGVWCVSWLLRLLWKRPLSLHETNLSKPSVRLALLGALGILLALGAYNPLYWVLYHLVPGFALFRVPARWLFLYAFAVSAIAGKGLERAGAWIRARTSALSPPPLRRASTIAQATAVVLALCELVLASQALPFSHPTAPQAFSSLRTAPAHIRAAQGESLAPGRFLSMSDTLFDPGDLDEMRGMFQEHLSEQAMYDYVVSAKRKEILAPNLPLAWRIHAVDGYDGGLLPLARYITLQRLFLDEADILVDGRLREGMERVPPSRLLSILGTRYVITDKVHDVWIDDVFYDLAFDAVLGTGAAAETVAQDIPPLKATGMGIVSYLEDGHALTDGTPVAQVRIDEGTGQMRSFTLRAGQDTAEGLYDDTARHTQAQIGHRWRDNAQGSDYVTRLSWETPIEVTRISITALPFDGRIHIRGLALLDGRDGSNVALTLSTDGRFQQVHSGDVKVYEVLDALPRAYIVHETRVALDDSAAVAAMADPSFDPSQTALLSSGQALRAPSLATSRAEITAYEPERVAILASTDSPGYLILSDAWYPGWEATVDGQPAPIERADVHFRGVYLDPGTHTVHLAYRPKSYLFGLGVSTATLLGIVILATRTCICPSGQHARLKPWLQRARLKP
jgi:hypothetical protein